MTLSHDVTGSGPTVVLLHSTAADRRMWDPQIPALTEAGFRVLRCDLRGFGESPMPTGPWNNADDVVALIGSLDSGRVALVGASGGGRVAIEIAARWPDRITRLVLLCTALRGHPHSPGMLAFGQREDELLEAGDIDGAVAVNVEQWLGPEADEAARTALSTMQRNVFEVQLAAEDPSPLQVEYDPRTVTARTLLVTGAHDLPDFREIAARLVTEIPGARHVELDWAGHLPSMERPDLINPLLVDALR
ncbi:alpha/beta fold hydrolase [Actinoplanes sp. NPDC051851]|uniref:alpha/beta fold hydrolase n=1 Tax=Actinoplanes sp. NPDC051851 TaxID=3154753 RepID=UPI0034257F5F